MNLREFFGLDSADNVWAPPATSLADEKKNTLQQASERKRSLMDPVGDFGNDGFAGIVTEAGRRQAELTGERERSNSETSVDFPISMARTAVDLIGGTGALANELNNKYGPAKLMLDRMLGDPDQQSRTPTKADTLLQRAASIRNNLAGNVRESRNNLSEGLIGGLQKVDNFLANKMSDVSNINEELVQEQIGLDAEQNRIEFDQAVMAGDNKALATAKRVGKDLLSGFGNTIDNPTVMANTVVGQAPSLFIGAGAKAAVTAEQIAVRAGTIARKRGVEVSREIMDEASSQLMKRNLAIGVGATEGGGAFQNTAEQILATDPAALAEIYPDYRDRLMDPKTANAARMDLARNSGITAAAITAPLAGAASRIAGDFELAPLAGKPGTVAARGLVGNAVNVGQETVEEAIQSGVGAFAGNAAAVLEGAQGIDLVQGVGAAAGQGAAGGFGMAATFQAPSAAKNLAAVPAKAAYDVVAGRVAEVMQNASKATQEQQAKTAAAYDSDATTLSQGFKDTSVQANEPVDSDPILTPEVAGILKGENQDPVNRVTALSRALNVLSIEGAVPEEQANVLKAFALKTARQVRADMQGVEDPRMQAAALGLLENENIRKLEEAVANIDPAVVENLFSNLPDNPIPNDVEMDPATASALEQIKELAYIAPDRFTTGQAEKVLFQSNRLSPEDTVQVTLARDIAKIRESHIAGMAKIQERTKFKSPDIVSGEIAEDGFTLNGQQRKSVSQHVRDVSQAFVNGDVQTAKLQMQRLAGFVEAMQRKAAAFDEAARRQIDAAGTELEDSWFDVEGTRKLSGPQSLGRNKNRINIKVDSSAGLIDAVFADASTVSDAYNTLAKAYPQILSASSGDNSPLPASITAQGKPTYKSYVPALKQEETVVEETPLVIEQPKLAVDFQAKPTEDSVKELDTALSLSEQEYLTKVNPENKTTEVPSDKAIDEELADTEPSSRAVVVRELSDGITLKADGDYLYAVRGEDTVGLLVSKEGGSQLYVASSERGKGLGKTLIRELLVRKPLAPTNGLSAAAQATRLSVLRSLREERTAVPASEIDARFPGLMPALGEMANKFTTGFRMAKKSRALFARVPNTLETVVQAISDAYEQKDPSQLLPLYVDEHQSMAPTDEQVTTLREIFGAFVPLIIDNLNQGLLNRATGKNLDGTQAFGSTGKPAKGFAEDLEVGKPIWQYANRLSLHVTQWGRDADGNFTISYQPEVAQAMAMSVLQWALGTVNNPINVNLEKLAQLYPEGVPPDLMAAYQTSHFATAPVRGIASEINQVLGVSADPNLSNTYANGLFTALAQDALQALEMTGAIAIDAVDGTKVAVPARNGKPAIMNKLYFVRFNKNADNNNWATPDNKSVKPLRDRLGGMALITRLMNPDSQELPTFGSPTTNVPTTQTGTRQKLSEQQRKAIAAANKIPFYANQPMMVMQEALGDANLLELLEFNDQDLTALNENHQRTVEGKNQGLEFAINNLREIFLLWQNEAESRNTNMREVPAYFSRRIISNGRMMMNGFGPQSDKIARETISAIRDTLDLRGNEAHRLGYDLSLAQALGIKTEQVKNTAAQRTIQNELQHSVYAQLFDDLNALGEMSEGDEQAALADEITRQIKAIQNGEAGVRKIPKTARALHALMTHARYLAAVEAGTDNEFTSYLAFELDGKTDGPINALVHFGLHTLDEKRISQLAKGGWFINVDGPRTLSDVGTSIGDLYQDTSDRLQAALTNILNDSETKPVKLKALRASIDLMSRIKHMVMEETDRGTKLQVFRAVSKGGLMTTTYGSGKRTVIGVLASEIMDHVYEQMSLALEEDNGRLDDQLQASLSILMSSYKDGSGQWQKIAPPNFSNRAKYQKGMFSPLHIRALVDNLTTTAGGQLVNIINGEMDPVLSTFALMYKASAFQSWQLRRDFNKAYADKRAAKIEAGELMKGDTLSRADEQDIMEALASKVPAYRTLLTGGNADQEGINVVEKDFGGELVNDDGSTAESRSIMGKLGTSINVTQIQNPGVRAAALTTIASGDATMMTQLQLNNPNGTLDVYDGWEVGPAQLADRALEVNEVVHKGWQFDVLGSVAETFESFDVVPTYLTDEEAVDLANFVRLPGREDAEPEALKTMLTDLVNQTRDGLNTRAQMTRINKQIINELPNSTDHMSGGERPFIVSGSLQENLMSFIEQRQKELLQQPTYGDQPTELEGNTELLKRLANNRELDKTDLQLLLESYPFENKVHAFVLKQIDHLIPDDLKIFLGSHEEIHAKQQELFPGVNFGGRSEIGATYKNSMFLKVGSEETLVHELIHATTYGLLRRYYNRKRSTLTVAQRDAVSQLELMTRAFVNEGFAGTTDEVAEALGNAQAAVAAHIYDGNIAEAVNEFMAWSLSNPLIQNAIEKTTVVSGLKNIGKRLLTLVRKMLGLPQNTSVENFLELALGQFHRLARAPVNSLIEEDEGGMAMFHSLGAGTAPNSQSERLIALAEEFEWMRLNLPKDGREDAQVLLASADALVRADEIRQSFVDAGFIFSPQEQYLFEQYQALMASTIQLDPGSVAAMQELYTQVIPQLAWEDFLDNPNSTNQIDEQIARDKFNAVLGSGNRSTDPVGRSNLLANFIALALVNEPLRQKLSGMKVQRGRTKATDLDGQVRAITSAAFDWFSNAQLTIGKAGNQRHLLDLLTTRLVKNQRAAVKRSNVKANAFEKIEAATKARLAQAGARAEAKLVERMDAGLVGGVDGWVNLSLNAIRGITTEEGGAAFAEAALSTINESNLPKPVRDLLAEMVGVSESNQPIAELLGRAKHVVSRVRQRLRDEAPGQVQELFSRPLPVSTWATMHDVVGKTDLQALLSAYTADQIRELLADPAALEAAQRSQETLLGVNRDAYARGAAELGHFLIHGQNASRTVLYRNAAALSRLLGQGKPVSEAEATRVEPILDRLITLRAVESLGAPERALVADLFQHEASGMEGVMRLLKGLSGGEGGKPDADTQVFNRWKGYVPVSRDPRSQLVLANGAKAAELVKQGYRKVGDYQGDVYDPGARGLAYYAVEWSGGQSTYNQGAMQTVEGTVSGVDRFTGRSLDPAVKTIISEPLTVAAITRRKMVGGGGGAHNLLPIFETDGTLIAYERLMDPSLVKKHTRETKDLANSVGVWMGRQAEEQIAREFNKQLVTVLKNQWVDGQKENRSGEYVDVSKSTTVSVADAWGAIPRETQRMLKTEFDNGPVMVRKDLINNALGYRSASIADVFTGMSDLGKDVRESMEKAAYGILGPNAYQRLVVAEKTWQALVGSAKDWIVVRSGVVAISNAIANQFQLLQHGVSPARLLQAQAAKVRETEIYLRHEKRLAQITFELTKVDRPDVRAKLGREEQSLRDAINRLSIFPLIQAGELPSIAEGLNEQDEFNLLADGIKWIQNKAEGVPGGLSTAARYALITKDTALYQGLNRMIQFGDFMAKAVLYDQLISQGLNQQEALIKVNESFVNYNLLAGRTRDYAEGMGLTWFLNYKLRIQKIILRVFRDNPLRFLMAGVGAEAVGSDSLLSGNAVAQNWDYAMGPGQFFRAHDMLLWQQLVD